jgi:fucokinase
LVHILVFQEGDNAEGVKLLSAAREKWPETRSNLARASRHYERAVQHMTSRLVSTARPEIRVSTTPAEEAKRAAVDTWVTATSPARIDLAGGWTDTPPICCQLGGRVAGIAVNVDGKVYWLRSMISRIKLPI